MTNSEDVSWYITGAYKHGETPTSGFNLSEVLINREKIFVKMPRLDTLLLRGPGWQFEFLDIFNIESSESRYPLQLLKVYEP